jgi:hypothetical protein
MLNSTLSCPFALLSPNILLSSLFICKTRRKKNNKEIIVPTEMLSAKEMRLYDECKYFGNMKYPIFNT